MESREIVKAKLAEWGLSPSDADLDELAPAYETMLRWNKIVSDMLDSRPMTPGMEFPLSEPILIHDIARYR